MNAKVMGAAVAALVALSVPAETNNPWSHLNFQDDPGDFRFAIVPDRGGGDYRGAFTNALECCNRMHPAFVMTVGDLINGYAGWAGGYKRQQDELTNFVSRVRAPFFYAVGNHDINVNLPPDYPKNYEMSTAAWREHFGTRTYYSFVYKKCLFVVLNTMDGRSERKMRSGISPEQYGWVRKTLAENADARWTFVFMHQPSEWRTDAWNRLETEVLVPRGRYTVFAGDWHAYFHVRRRGFDYYILSVAGGVGNRAYALHKDRNDPARQDLAGPEYGEMDHITWVTMTADGPDVVNLKLDGILPGEYLNRANSKDESNLTVLDIPPDPKAIQRCKDLKRR